MRYYSTTTKIADTTLRQAVEHGLAPDHGLYMPESIPVIPRAVINNFPEMSLTEKSYVVATTLFGSDLGCEAIKEIIDESLTFDIPVVPTGDNTYSLELYHGPTLSFKDTGARFMARLLKRLNTDSRQPLNVLVATSGDSGGAVANGFLGIDDINVFVLYPSGKISKMQEAQFATLGSNVTALEVFGTFDDCQSLVKQALLDPNLSKRMRLTSANSINIARLLPQTFYYFHAVGQLMARGIDPTTIVFSVPCGNLGNLTAALLAYRMGLPVKRFIAANNRNSVFTDYLATGKYAPIKSIRTIASAMDVGSPNNFSRILDLYNGDYNAITHDITGAQYNDLEIADAIKTMHERTGYILDPHGAVAWRALVDNLKPEENGLFVETAHPSKFKTTVEYAICQPIETPEALVANVSKPLYRRKLSANYNSLKNYLLSTL